MLSAVKVKGFSAWYNGLATGQICKTSFVPEAIVLSLLFTAGKEKECVFQAIE